MTRREWSGGMLAVLAALTAGCATVSPSEEKKLGREAADEVENTIGLVRDPRPVEYVRRVAGRLAQTAQRADIAWQFNVADDAAPNAFALPGGWVYVTRGLLALLNTEDELAGVLGHEMSHVTERHAVRQARASTPFTVLFGVPAAILGTVSPTLGGIVGGTGQLLSKVTLAPYSRDQEREADERGIALAARAGWDPMGLAASLHALHEEEALAAGDPDRGGFLATHPSSRERVATIQDLARKQGRASTAPIAGSRNAFLGRLEGLVIGDNPATGVFLGTLFVHPDLDAAMNMPAGWKTANTPAAAGAAAPPDGDAAVLLGVAGPGDDPIAGAKADGLKDADLKRLQRLQISGLPAARVLAETRDGDRAALTWIAHRPRIFRVLGLAPRRAWDRYGAVLDRAARSFRPLRPADRERILESRLRLRPARAGETVAQVLARGGGTWDAARMAVANGRAPDAKLEAGWPVKVPVLQRYGAGP
ncbi:MAG TPA: M48 family metalloprotease [Verrucomicrobiae bacterium]|jgi:predicted Zn-dependent protease|nr:M48 family metalloprotease [Verrucomicrobiae bacterium]